MMMMMRIPIVIVIVIMGMAALLQTCGGAAGKLHPVVLIPGNGGNQLEARLTKDYKPSSFFCKLWARRNDDGWFRLWFDPLALLKPFTICFTERMKLRYVPEIDDYRNALGVETRVPHFGSTLGLRYLDPNLRSISEYMETLVQSLEKMGYRDGDNLFGATYDFRYGLASESHPSQVGDLYLAHLKHLIEDAAEPVILLAHSLGNLFAMQLLLRSAPDWRRRHIKHLISLSPPWAGTVISAQTFASGSTLGVPLVDPFRFRDEQRSSESNMWLLPFPAVFKNRTLVRTPTKNYSSLDMEAFLEDIGYGEGVGRYRERVLPLVEETAAAAPEVPVTCVVGTGVKTPETLIYGEEGFDEQPEIVFGDGDGTVNLESLMALRSSDGDRKVKFVEVKGVSHTDVLKDPPAIAEITNEIQGINSASSHVGSRTLSLERLELWLL